MTTKRTNDVELFLKKVDVAVSLKKRGLNSIEEGDHVLGGIKLLLGAIIGAWAFTMVPDLIGEV